MMNKIRSYMRLIELRICKVVASGKQLPES